MVNKNIVSGLLKELNHFVILAISMTGFVPKNATVLRTLIYVLCIISSLYISIFQPDNTNLATIYFLISEFLYFSFLMIVLSKNGLRHWFVKKWGAKEGYLVYETVLGFLFFHNLISIGYISSSSPGNLLSFMDKSILLIPLLILFAGGFLVKILSAKAVTIEIYYLKDMFLGRKISDFIESGPYKYISNPMYGVGQLQTYATALWYGSEYGLIAAFLNQLLVFTFYYTVERKFIRRTYLKIDENMFPNKTIPINKPQTIELE